MMTSINNLYEEMNTYLADEIVLGMKIHNFHWFLKGDGFFPIHAELDHFYEASQERVDEVAERILTIDAKPIPSLQAALDASSIEELGADWISAKEGFEKLIVDFEHMNRSAIRLVKLAEEVEDPATADYFTSVSAELGKNLWMFKSYIR